MIIFRGDGGSKMGLGHIMRLLTIAKSVKKLNEEVLFVLADDAVKSLVEENGFATYVLHSSYDDLEGELPLLLSLIFEKKPGAVLLDSYFVTPKYLSELRKEVYLAYLDDVNAFAYDVDLLINYNIYAKNMPYQKEGYVQNNTELLLGCAYMPLREEFKQVTHSQEEQVKKILLSTGGSDSLGIAEKILRMALAEKDLEDKEYHVVLGAVNTSLPAMKKLAEENSKIKLHVNEKEMGKLMAQMDLAVSAAGSTMYELASVGVPTICFFFADNQKELAAGFRAAEIACYGADYRENEKAFLEGLKKEMQALVKDACKRHTLSENAKNVVDGKGAERIALKLCKTEKM